MKVLVSLGYFDDSGEGRLLGVDLTTGRSEVLLSYFPPPPLRVPTRGFTGACLGEDGSVLYAAGHAAVFRVSTRTWMVDGILHIPSFNDLHHVAAREGRLFVANTGSDSVDVFSYDGRFVGAHMLVPPWVLAHKMQGRVPDTALDVYQAGWEAAGNAAVKWQQADAALRCEEEDGYHTAAAKRATTPYSQAKLPDRLHPNHTCPLPTQTLVTCLQDGSIRDLRTLHVVHQQEGCYPHDGMAAEGRFFFTTIDGKLWALPLAEGVLQDTGCRGEGDGAAPAAQCWDVSAQSGRCGWCRGLLIQPSAGGCSAAVGFTEMRQGRLPRYRWCARLPAAGSQTGVAWLDLVKGRPLGWADLSDVKRHSKIYSILPWSGV